MFSRLVIIIIGLVSRHHSTMWFNVCSWAFVRRCSRGQRRGH